MTYRLTYAKAVYGNKEIAAVNEVLNSGNTMLGKNVNQFEQKVANLFGKKHGIMVNSGSSANMLALELLNLEKGSELITPSLTFATTVAPIVQKGLTPCFVDVDIETFQINIDEIEKNINENTKVLMIPSLIGNIPDYLRLRKIADKHNLILIEDSCDTIGATISGKPTGIYSDISTTSFYGSHIITAAGGGGMICVNSDEWKKKCKILRGWGRASEIMGDSVEERFKEKLEGIPYDAKFIFDSIGYNFLPLEISGAFGLEQLEKLKNFSKIRQENFSKLYKFFEGYKNLFYLPKQSEDVSTNWLAFPITLKNSSFDRLSLVKHLENNKIQTRPVFTGNILRQPGFKNIEWKGEENFDNADYVMKNSLLLGCHHGMKEEDMTYLLNALDKFLSKY